VAAGPGALVGRTRRPRRLGGAEHDLRLVLEVADHNHDAIAFYERRSWRQVGTTSLLLDDGLNTHPLVVYVLDA
jgi:ribosomal protein S18 acetylase RimI-like enzyme